MSYKVMLNTSEFINTRREAYMKFLMREQGPRALTLIQETSCKLFENT